MIDPGKGPPQATAGAKASSTFWKATYQLGRRRGKQKRSESRGRRGRRGERGEDMNKKVRN